MRALISAGLALLLASGASLAADQPYRGEDARDIASLSPDEIEGLLTGAGSGYAKAAELNGYPGPAHVLELAEDLALTPDQRNSVEAVFAAMNAEARALGADFVAVEDRLDAAFEDGTITAATLAALTAEAAAIEARLRATHLAAHLEITPLLTRHQRVTYNRLRGYGGAAHDGGGHGGH